jgi:sugar O-acyltransferase (sialic acid O-acetyltransferase NeuD family)
VHACRLRPVNRQRVTAHHFDRRRLVLLGTGLFAEELTDVVADVQGAELVAYCENLDRSKAGQKLLGKPIVWIEDLPSLDAINAVCAITTPERERYVDQVRALGVPFGRLVHPSAVIARSATLGEGVVIGASAVIGARTTISDQVMINRGALIGHHVHVGEFATIQPGAVIGGAGTVGARAYVAMGARVLDRLRIGEGALVGAGAVVTRDVQPHHRVVGVPARRMGGSGTPG